jgi:hypothetical protein
MELTCAWETPIKRGEGGESKMVTVTQTQTAWAQGIRDLAEMLETHLAEVKHQGELKLWHPKLLGCGRLLHIMINWKNMQATAHSLAYQASGLQARRAATRQPTGTLAADLQAVGRNPQEHSERRNSASNQWEFHRDVTRHGQPKRTEVSQEIPRQQK